ncbi:hypothetical protein ACFFS2_03435 [Streptomyces aurantiacus]|uniref:hypothetical protein n=1 Tax=Streptomyces aurantiacus TaxID=47760 RepID=UPI00168431BE|nr:hypothetical protein [Streptomyces aurantiacus]MDQ0777594.1 hypothetical protein [Streptomyces aurantiacus]
MSDAHTMETSAADLRGTSAQADDDGGQGRHRGPVSAQEDGATPRGRHRRPAEQNGTGV